MTVAQGWELIKKIKDKELMHYASSLSCSSLFLSLPIYQALRSIMRRSKVLSFLHCSPLIKMS